MMFFVEILFALLLLLQEMTPFFRVLALGPLLLSAAFVCTDVIPAWYTELSHGTIPGGVQWMIWLSLFPIWWKLAPVVRSSSFITYWSLAIVAVSCAFRPPVTSLFSADEEPDFGFVVDDKFDFPSFVDCKNLTNHFTAGSPCSASSAIVSTPPSSGPTRSRCTFSRT